MSLAKLAALCKGAVEWERFFELVGKPAPKSLNVDNPVALAAAARLLDEAEPSALRAYLRWHVARSCANHLPKPFVDGHFEFFAKALGGQQEQKPRWKRAMPWAEAALGECIGQLYVAKYFKAEAKTRALATVERVRKV